MPVRLRRRLDARSPDAARDRPTVLVRPELVRAIAAEAAHAHDHETGGPLLGTVERTWDGERLAPLVSVLGTVLPGFGVDGRLSSVSLGRGADGDRAAGALRWLRDVTGLDLQHVGDWHVHPSGVARPSVGDCKTADAMHAAAVSPVWLVAVAVSRNRSTDDVRVAGAAALVNRDCAEEAEVRVYRATERGLLTVRPKIEGVALPRLPPLPWHVADRARFAAECRLLHAAGFATAVDANGTGLALQLTRDGRTLAAVTGPRYPREEPVLYDERGRRVRPRSQWSPDRFLVDVVREACDE
jgi:proteasome lid subunit RPN8/RPN11